MRVFVKSARDFESTMKILKINEKNVTERTDEFFILVKSNSDNELEKTYFSKDTTNVVVIEADEIHRSKYLLNFIKKMSDRSKCFIQDYGKLSVGGAIASFIVDLTKSDYRQFTMINTGVVPDNSIRKVLISQAQISGASAQHAR